MSLAIQTAMKIRLTDINIRHRDVEVPTQCPHCTANLVPTPEDDGFNPTIGVIDGQQYNGRLIEETGNGPSDPELLSIEDHFDVGSTTSALVAFVACGNPACGRIILEGEVTYT
jgi:hypothetical protein